MNLNGKVFNPGELRTSVVLQRRTITQDAGGFSVPGWSTLATVWSKWENAHGNDVSLQNTEYLKGAATVTIRYRSDVNAGCAVLKGTERFEIVSLDNIRERSEYLELRVRRVEVT